MDIAKDLERVNNEFELVGKASNLRSEKLNFQSKTSKNITQFLETLKVSWILIGSSNLINTVI